MALTAVLSLVALAVWPGPDPVLALDADGDLIPDSEEAIFGTNPNSADSDSDGWDDWAEIFEHGTDPNLADTDGDSLVDPEDDWPLAADSTPGGSTNVDSTYYTNLTPKEARTGVSASEGVGVYVHNGEFVYRQPLLHVRGRRIDMDFTLTYRSGITYNGPVGMNWQLAAQAERQGAYGGTGTKRAPASDMQTCSTSSGED